MSFINNSEGKVTKEWLKEGKYQLETSFGKFDAKIRYKSPYDPDNKEILC